MTTGVALGKFLPLHQGHLLFLKKCLHHCNNLIIVVSYSPLDDTKCTSVGWKPIPLSIRKQWLEYTAERLMYMNRKKNKHISVVTVDESNIPHYPDGWEPFIELLKKSVNKPFNMIFSSETEYDPEYKRYLPDVKHVIIDPNRHKNENNISATMVREQQDKYLNGFYVPYLVHTYIKRINNLK